MMAVMDKLDKPRIGALIGGIAMLLVWSLIVYALMSAAFSAITGR